jgi:hypothetical protein
MDINWKQNKKTGQHLLGGDRSGGGTTGQVLLGGDGSGVGNCSSVSWLKHQLMMNFVAILSACRI